MVTAETSVSHGRAASVKLLYGLVYAAAASFRALNASLEATQDRAGARGSRITIRCGKDLGVFPFYLLLSGFK